MWIGGKLAWGGRQRGVADTGAVDTSTTPSVQYTYSDPSTASLSTFMVCPNDNTIDYNSGDAGTTPRVQNLYQGMLQDPVTGLYYERARWYSPSLGTWISQDPLQYINGANTYQFVGRNPVGRVDGHGRPYRKCTGVNATGYFFAARLAIDARNFEARDVAVVVGGPDNGKYVGAIYWGFSMFWTGKTMEQVWWGMPKHAAVGPVAPGLSAPANVPVPGVSSGVAVAPQE